MKTNKLLISLSLIIVFFGFSSRHVQSQISGNYTIGGEAPDYVDFNDAIYALNNSGIAGDVQFLVSSGSYFNVSFSSIENAENYKIEFVYNGASNDSASIIGQLKVYRTANVSFKGFTIFPAQGQKTSCISIVESNNFSIDSCKVLNLFNNKFSSDDALILLKYSFSGPKLVSRINNCIINSQNRTLALEGKQGKLYMNNSNFTGIAFNRFSYVGASYEDNIFHMTDYLFTLGNQTFKNNVFYFGEYPLHIKGNLFNNVFHCDVMTDAINAVDNIFYGSVRLGRTNQKFINNIVMGEFVSTFCHGIFILSNHLYSNCSLTNDYTKFANNFLYGSVISFTHGPNQYIFNNNFSDNSQLQLWYVGGLLKNNNINSLWMYSISSFAVENNNFFNLAAGEISTFGEKPSFFNPLYKSDSSLYATNPLLIAKGTAPHGFFKLDIDSVLRKSPCTIGANEICFNWQVDEVDLNCGESLCLDLCIDSMENMFWSPDFLFSDSTALRPVIYPETSTIIYLNLADGGIVDSLRVNVSPSIPMAFATFSCDTLTVVFENKSRCADTYYWDFGDGAFSLDESPVHTYSASGIYHCKLTAYNELGSSEYTFIIDFITNVENNSLQSTILVYPNPTHKTIRIDSKITIENLVLTDLNGRIMLHTKVESENDHQLNLEYLNIGIYLLKITTNQGTTIKKVIKL